LIDIFVSVGPHGALFNEPGAVFEEELLVPGLDIGNVSGTTTGRTVHVEVDIASPPDMGFQKIYSVYSGPIGGDQYESRYVRSSLMLDRFEANQTRIRFYEGFTPAFETFTSQFVVVPNENLVGRVLLSYDFRLVPTGQTDEYNSTIRLYMNGALLGERFDYRRTYVSAEGRAVIGRERPCAQQSPSALNPVCKPFFGTIHSLTMHTDPLPSDFHLPDVWQQCTAPKVESTTSTTATSTTAAPTTSGVDQTSTSSSSPPASTTASPAITGGNLDGGGAAVGVDKGGAGDSVTDGATLPLIIALVTLFVVCTAALGFVILWQSRRRRTHVEYTLADTLSTDAPDSLAGSRSRNRSRSGSKRRRNASGGQYASIAIPPVSDDYTTMHTVDSSNDAGYSDIAMDVDDSGTSSAYGEIHRGKDLSPSSQTYATGDLSL
jgi:hypothetical protein